MEFYKDQETTGKMAMVPTRDYDTYTNKTIDSGNLIRSSADILRIEALNKQITRLQADLANINRKVGS